MRKSSWQSALLDKRLASYVLGVLALFLVLSPGPARADGLVTQTFTDSGSGLTKISTDFSSFNTALGTLQSISITIDTSTSLATPQSFFDTISVIANGQFQGVTQACLIAAGSTIPCTINFSTTDTNSSDLASAGTLPDIPFSVQFNDSPSAAFGTSSATFTLVYDYTTPRSAPEPGTSSLLLAGGGLLGLVIAMRKRVSLGHGQAT